MPTTAKLGLVTLTYGDSEGTFGWPKQALTDEGRHWICFQMHEFPESWLEPAMQADNETAQKAAVIQWAEANLAAYRRAGDEDPKALSDRIRESERNLFHAYGWITGYGWHNNDFARFQRARQSVEEIAAVNTCPKLLAARRVGHDGRRAQRFHTITMV